MPQRLLPQRLFNILYSAYRIFCILNNTLRGHATKSEQGASGGSVKQQRCNRLCEATALNQINGWRRWRAGGSVRQQRCNIESDKLALRAHSVHKDGVSFFFLLLLSLLCNLMNSECKPFLSFNKTSSSWLLKPSTSSSLYYTALLQRTLNLLRGGLPLCCTACCSKAVTGLL